MSCPGKCPVAYKAAGWYPLMMSSNWERCLFSKNIDLPKARLGLPSSRSHAGNEDRPCIGKGPPADGVVAAVVLVTFNRYLLPLGTHWLNLQLRSRVMSVGESSLFFAYFPELGHPLSLCHLPSQLIASPCRARYLEQTLASLFAVHGSDPANRCLRQFMGKGAANLPPGCGQTVLGVGPCSSCNGERQAQLSPA